MSSNNTPKRKPNIEEFFLANKVKPGDLVYVFANMYLEPESGNLYVSFGDRPKLDIEEPELMCAVEFERKDIQHPDILYHKRTVFSLTLLDILESKKTVVKTISEHSLLWDNPENYFRFMK